MRKLKVVTIVFLLYISLLELLKPKVDVQIGSLTILIITGALEALVGFGTIMEFTIKTSIIISIV